MTRRRRLDVRLGSLVWVTLVSLGLAGVTRGNTVIIAPSSEITVTTDFFGNVTSFNGLQSVFGPTPDSYPVNSAAALVFDLSFIPRSTVITSATFTMSASGDQNDLSDTPPTIPMFSYVAPSSVLTLSNFSESEANPLGALQGLQANEGPGSFNAVTNFNVGALIQSMVMNGTPFVGFNFGNPLFENFDGSFFLLEAFVSIPGTTLPSLTITSPSLLVVPEPPGALLLVLGLAGIVVVMKVRSRKILAKA